MSTTTLGIKLDVETRKRLSACADRLDRTAHWCMKIAIQRFIEKVEQGAEIKDLLDADRLASDTLKHSVILRNSSQSM